MQKKCEYCGTLFDDTLKKCPTCGAPNDNIARSSNEQPTTIDELKKWYKNHNLPPESVTRFYIGKDVKEKRAFGIYKDSNSGNIVVYKNKDNGQRAIRYSGKDEKYAVNELYQKLKEEISNQKQVNKQKKTVQAKKTNPSYTSYSTKQKSSIFEIIGDVLATIIWHPGLIFLIVVVGVFISALFDDSGYYTYNGNEYYRYKDNWYCYDDDINDWYFAEDLDPDFSNNYKDYYTGYSYKDDYGANFEDSDYYDNSSSSSSSSNSSSYTDDDDWGSDWDNDSSWDSSDSWDSGSTDWDSDW